MSRKSKRDKELGPLIDPPEYLRELARENDRNKAFLTRGKGRRLVFTDALMKYNPETQEATVPSFSDRGIGAAAIRNFDRRDADARLENALAKCERELEKLVLLCITTFGNCRERSIECILFWTRMKKSGKRPGNAISAFETYLKYASEHGLWTVKKDT